MNESPAAEPELPARRRRRAVGPPGARQAEPVGERELHERPEPPDDDERLLADVPPHHGRV